MIRPTSSIWSDMNQTFLDFTALKWKKPDVRLGGFFFHWFSLSCHVSHCQPPSARPWLAQVEDRQLNPLWSCLWLPPWSSKIFPPLRFHFLRKAKIPTFLHNLSPSRRKVNTRPAISIYLQPISITISFFVPLILMSLAVWLITVPRDQAVASPSHHKKEHFKWKQLNFSLPPLL